METENLAVSTEETRLKTLLDMEDLAAKKAGVYSRLLIDAQLSQKMEEVEKRHQARKATLENLLGLKTKKQKGEGQVRGESA